MLLGDLFLDAAPFHSSHIAASNMARSDVLALKSECRRLRFKPCASFVARQKHTRRPIKLADPFSPSASFAARRPHTRSPVELDGLGALLLQRRFVPGVFDIA